MNAVELEIKTLEKALETKRREARKIAAQITKLRSAEKERVKREREQDRAAHRHSIYAPRHEIIRLRVELARILKNAGHSTDAIVKTVGVSMTQIKSAEKKMRQRENA